MTFILIYEMFDHISHLTKPRIASKAIALNSTCLFKSRQHAEWYIASKKQCIEKITCCLALNLIGYLSKEKSPS